MINEIKFNGRSKKYACLSNFYECPVFYEGIQYNNSEAAWQSLKVEDKEERKKFSELSGKEAKSHGKEVKLREDWDEIKYDLMFEVCYAKFSQNPALAETLLETDDSIIIENTTPRHDNIWGNCDCKRCANIIGDNHLGKALMKVRTKLRN